MISWKRSFILELWDYLYSKPQRVKPWQVLFCIWTWTRSIEQLWTM